MAGLNLCDLHAEFRAVAHALLKQWSNGDGWQFRTEAHQRGCARGAGDAGRGAQASAGGTGRHSAPEYSAYRGGSRSFHQGRQARKDWAGRNVLLLPYAGDREPADIAPPPYLDYEMWTGPAPMRPYNKLVHPRGWRAFMEYGNGIVGDMCIHMFDMVRWMLDLGWPKRVSSEGGILIDKNSKSNISDTQTATFDYDDVKLVW